MTLRATLLAAPVALAALPAAAVPLAEFQGSFQFSFDFPEGGSVETDDLLVGVPDVVQSGDGVVEGAVDDFGDTGVTDEEEDYAISGLATAGTNGEASILFGPPTYEIVTLNETESELVASLVVEYTLSASASVDDPSTENASSEISFVFSPGDFSADGFIDTLSFDASNPGSDTVSGVFQTDLVLEPSSNQLLTINLAGEASATAAPIPVPAALPLMIAALGGLALLRRRIA